jgi:type I restriction enzyme M protein
MRIAEILKDSNYKLTQFNMVEIQNLENRIIEKDVRGKATPYVKCLVRKKEIKLTPEEAIRQLYIQLLIDDYEYPVERMELEYAVSFGREKKRADIVIFDKQQTTSPYIMVELKKPKLKDGKEQLKSYCNATGAPIGIWSNGESVSFYHRKDPNYFEDIPAIPKAIEKLSDILTERWTIDDLIERDELRTQKKSLKDKVLEMEDEVLANAGVDVFEELFKLIFTKLFDEMESGRNRTRYLEFRNYGDTETELKEKIQNLFDRAKTKWEGVFSVDSRIELTASHLSVCVASLQGIKLFNSNLDVVDDAFEYLINKSSKGEKGQYFTPRYVIEMCVKMLNPQEYETMIDSAAGSCGFPVHTIFHVWEQIMKDEGLDKSHLFTLEQKPARCTDYVNDKVFAIDFDEKSVRVARTLNLIAGDGQTNVLHLNTLDWERWDEKTNDEDWQDTYFEGWRKFKKLRTNKNNQDFSFDILMANPPFAGDIKESRILAKYELGKKSNGKYQTKVGRDILFIERNLDFLKPGGRMAIVLPQGRFNNSSDKNIRDFIAERCRILAVVGLHGNVFKPHTGTKTSVLFVQKWDNKLCPKVEDYPIFFATMQESSKDTSGDKIYLRKKDFPDKFKIKPEVADPVQGEMELKESVVHYVSTPKDLDEYVLDSHDHLIVKHDLFNHDGKTQEGIAEAFLEFAKKENLSFVGKF